MPNLEELLNSAKAKTEKKKFSRGNRPDTMLRNGIGLGSINCIPETPDLEPSHRPLEASVDLFPTASQSSDLVNPKFDRSLNKALSPDVKVKAEIEASTPAIGRDLKTENLEFYIEKSFEHGTQVNSRDASELNFNKVAVNDFSLENSSLKKIDLNAPDDSILNDNSALHSSTLFSNSVKSDKLVLRSDTDLTQKGHRSDTEVTQISMASDTEVTQIFANNSLKKTPHESLKNQKISHRSDTTSPILPKLDLTSSDTEVTQTSQLEIINRVMKIRSDTEVTQIESHPTLYSNLRSDTEVTQAKNVDPVLSNLKATASIILEKLSDKIQSDTEVTQTLKNRKPVSFQAKDLTQTSHRSDTEVTPISTQKRHKEVTQISAHSDSDLVLRRILVLRGNGLNVFNFCCSALLQIGQNLLQTSYEAIAMQTTVNIGSIKTTLKRLRDEKLLNIDSHGGGKGAFIEIVIEDAVLKVFARNQNTRSDTDLTQILPQKRHRSDTNLDTNPSSMYVSNINNTIHTESPPSVESEIWTELREVNFSILAQWSIRPTIVDTFKKNNWKISRQDLEDQIERFARYFSEKEYEGRRAKIQSQYSFFLGCIRAIAKGEPNPIQDVKTQIEISQEEGMKRRLLEMENRKRQYEAMEKQLNEYRDSEFEQWVSMRSEAEQIKLVPPSKIGAVGSISYRLLLKAYYTENIWPSFKQSFLNGPQG